MLITRLVVPASVTDVCYKFEQGMWIEDAKLVTERPSGQIDQAQDTCYIWSGNSCREDG